MPTTPNLLESVFVQRNVNNLYYEQINISGSDLIFYHSSSGEITADKISVFATKYGLSGIVVGGSYNITTSYASSSISSSYANTASYVIGFSVDIVSQSLYSSQSISSSYSQTSSYALNANSGLISGSNYEITTSWSITSSVSLTSSYFNEASASLEGGVFYLKSNLGNMFKISVWEDGEGNATLQLG